MMELEVLVRSSYLSRFALVAVACLVFALPSLAQQAVSARAGMINFEQGAVLLDDEQLEPERYQFPQMNDGQVLRTEAGLVEVLLNAGTFLRMAEDSSFRLDASDLTDTRLSVLTGTVLIEVADLLNDNSVRVNFGGQEIQLHKNGLYHFTAGEVPRLRVYDGEARIADADPNEDPLKIKKGREEVFTLAKLEEPEKFDRDETDALYRWSVRRARVIARANVSSARLADSRYPSGLTSSFMNTSMNLSLLSMFSGVGWSFNPYYGGFTYLPGSGYMNSPFGVTLFSPQAIRIAMRPQVYFPNPSFPTMGLGGGGAMIGMGGAGFNVGGGGGVSMGAVSGGGAVAAPGGAGAAGGAPRSGGGAPAAGRR